MNIKGQGHSLTFVQGHSDSTFSNMFFAQKPLGQLKPNFIWSLHGMWGMKICSNEHVHICWKTSKIFFFGTKRLMSLKLGIQHRVLEYYQCFHMMTLGWPLPFLWQGQIYYLMLLHGWKLIQHWVFPSLFVFSISSALRWAIQDQWSSDVAFVMRRIIFIVIYGKIAKCFHNYK